MLNKKSPSSIDRHIGSRIRMRRILIGMSQEKLGEHLGITFQQVQKYEKGVNRVGSGRLHEIGSILGVSASFFFEGLFFEGQGGKVPSAEDSQVSSVPSVLLAQKDSLQLLQTFDAITDQKAWRALVNLAHALAGQAADDEVEVSQPSPARRKAFSHSS
jgi:transcriptional regulator with XRE-family HTH domain